MLVTAFLLLFTKCVRGISEFARERQRKEELLVLGQTMTKSISAAVRPSHGAQRLFRARVRPRPNKDRLQVVIDRGWEK